MVPPPIASQPAPSYAAVVSRGVPPRAPTAPVFPSPYLGPAALMGSSIISSQSTVSHQAQPQITQRPSATTPAASTSSAFPPALRRYVERSLAQCSDDASRRLVEQELKTTIAKVSQDNRLHVHKWDLEPLPRLPSATASVSACETPVPAEAAAVAAAATEPASKKRKSRFACLQDSPTSAVVPSSSSPPPLSVYGPAGASRYDDKQIVKKSNSKLPDGVSDDSFLPLDNDADDKSVAKKKKGNARSEKAKEKAKEKEKKRMSRSSTTLLYEYADVCAYCYFFIYLGYDASPLPFTSSASPAVPTVLTEEELQQLIVVGTCQSIEKDYFRLTSAPDPTTVRPEPVLRLALEALKDKWATVPRQVDYEYMCSQLKAIRQDATVQHLKNGESHDVIFVCRSISFHCFCPYRFCSVSI